MKVLVACEESQIVTEEFRKLGHEAYSCDVEPCSGNYPKWHLQQDVIHLLKEPWDLMIAHPPCTYISNSSAKHLYIDMKKENGINKERWKLMEEGALFFKKLWNADIPKIAIENPIMLGYAKDIIGSSKSQIIQPWQFGHGETKATCLWLKNLSLLKPTNIVEGREQKMWKMGPSKNRSKLRSKTYQGIAEAFANQWS